MFNTVKAFADGLTNFLNRPVRVFWFCVCVLAANVLLDGSFLQLWSLHRDHHRLAGRIEESKGRLKNLEFRIQKAQQPQFIERQARDQFDLVKEGDLIFVFSDDPPETGNAEI